MRFFIATFTAFALARSAHGADAFSANPAHTKIPSAFAFAKNIPG